MSGITTGAALAIAGGVGAAGAVGGSLIGANAAGNAASTQANASDEAAQLQYQAEEQALQFQEQEFAQQQENIQPWLQTGGSAEMEMAQLLGLPSASGGGTPSNPFAGSNATPNPTVPTAPTPPGTAARNQTQFPGSSTLNMSSLTQPTGPTLTAAGPQYAGTLGGTPPGNPTPTSTTTPMQWHAMDGSSGAPAARTGVMSNPSLSMSSLTQAPNLGAVGPQYHGPLNGGTPSPTTAPAGGGTNPNSANLSAFAPWTTPFTAPTLQQAEQNPGYQFQQEAGTQAVENQFASNGELLDPNEQMAESNYNQGLAQTDYQQVYNNALQQYQQSYNIYQNNQANQWNRLASLAGMGQVSAGQLNSAGSSAAGNVGNILLGSGSQIGNSLQNAGAATASGYIGEANAYGGGISSLSNLGSTLSLASLLGQNGAGGNTAANPNYNPFQSTPGDF